MWLEVLHIVWVIVAFGAIMGIGEYFYKFRQIPVELTRKFIHISCGIIVALFPWIFATPLSFLVLAAGLTFFFVSLRFLGKGKSIYDVERTSLGDFCALIAIIILYLHSHYNHYPIYYFIAILTMTVADSLAALLGITYHKTTYSVENQSKSLEGSAVFFLFTFLIVHIPLLIFTDIDRTASILLAFLIALIVTCIEAICLYGTDNIIVPLATYTLLLRLDQMPPSYIAELLATQIVFIAIFVILVWKQLIHHVSGAIAAQLFFYGAYTVGSPKWILAPGIGLTAFSLLNLYKTRQLPDAEKPSYQVLAAFYIILVPGILLFISHVGLREWPQAELWKPNDPFYLFFIGSIASHFVVSSFRLFRQGLQDNPWKPFVIIFLSSLALIVFPSLLLTTKVTLLNFYLIVLTILLASILFFLFTNKKSFKNKFVEEFQIQAMTNGTAIFLVGIIYFLIFNQMLV